MANYVTQTSDKTRKEAKRRLFMGGIGLHYFYVGKIGTGIVRMIFSILLLVLAVTGIAEKETAMIISGFVFYLVINLFDLVRISAGRFRDYSGLLLKE